jgi:hypothetical protein
MTKLTHLATNKGQARTSYNQDLGGFTVQCRDHSFSRGASRPRAIVRIKTSTPDVVVPPSPPTISLSRSAMSSFYNDTVLQ